MSIYEGNIGAIGMDRGKIVERRTDVSGIIDAAEKDMSIREYWSCRRKKRYDLAPRIGPTMTVYACHFCGGWHKASLRRG